MTHRVWLFDIDDYDIGYKFEIMPDSICYERSLEDCYEHLISQPDINTSPNCGIIEIVDNVVVRKYSVLECSRIIKLKQL